MGRGSGAGIAGGGSLIAGGDENRNAFGDGLLVKRAEECVRGSPVFRLALAIAEADDLGRKGAVDQIVERDRAAEGHIGIGAGGDHDVGVGRGGAGPFGIEDRFAIIAVDAGHGTIAGVRGGEPSAVLSEAEGGAEHGPVIGIVQIGVLDDSNGLAFAGESGGEGRRHIVDGGKIAGDDGVFPGILIAESEIRARSSQRSRLEIVQRGDAGDDRRECLRDLWIADVGDMRLATGAQGMNLRAKRVAYLGRGSGKIDDQAAGRNGVHLKAVGAQPLRDGIDILLRSAVAFSELRGGQPAMKIRGLGIVKIVDNRRTACS